MNPLHRIRREGVLHALPVALVIIATFWYVLRANVDFWYDEAMLVTAIQHEGWLAPWQPMALFEQAEPYGVYVLQKAWLGVVGVDTDALRLLDLTAYALGTVLVWQAARRVLRGWAGPLAAVIAGSSAIAVGEAGDFKQYAFEYAASALMLMLGLRLRDRYGRVWPCVLFFLAACGSLLFSYSVEFVVAGIVATLLLECAIVRRDGWRRCLLQLAVGAVGFGIVAVAWYVFAVHPASLFQLAYPTYAQQATLGLYSTLVQTVAQPSSTFFIPVLSVVLLGCGIAGLWHRRLLPVFGFAAFTTCIAGVALVLGFAPFSAERHVLFLVPPIALAFGATVSGAWSTLSTLAPPAERGRRLVVGLIAAAAIVSALVTVKPNAGVQLQQIGQALQESKSSCAHYWVDWWTQPAAQMYAEQLGMQSRVAGLVSERSGLGQQAWAYRLIDHPRPYQRRLTTFVSTHPDTCLVLGGRPDETTLVLAPLQRMHMSCSVTLNLGGAQLFRCARRRGRTAA